MPPGSPRSVAVRVVYSVIPRSKRIIGQGWERRVVKEMMCGYKDSLSGEFGGSGDVEPGADHMISLGICEMLVLRIM